MVITWATAAGHSEPDRRRSQPSRTLTPNWTITRGYRWTSISSSRRWGIRKANACPHRARWGPRQRSSRPWKEAAEEDFLAECGGCDGQAADDGDDRSGDVRVLERRGGDERQRRLAEAQ